MGESRFPRTSNSFPGIRRVYRRLRSAFSFSSYTASSSDDDKDGNMQDDRFAFPFSKLNLNHIITDSCRKQNLCDVTPPRGKGNTPLIERSPFSRPCPMEMTTVRNEGHVARTSQAHSIESEPGVMREASSSGPSHHPSHQNQSISSEQPLFSELPKPTISERLAILRPRGCIGIGDCFPVITTVDGRDQEQPPSKPSNHSPHFERSSAAYSVHLLQHSQMPVIQDCDLIKGHLTDEEWMFYKNFSGTWIANEAYSDDISSVLGFLGMPSVESDMKRAECMKLYIDKHHIHLWSDVQGFDEIDEQRPWTGGKVIQDRRDRRQGGAECWVERYSHGLIFRTRWFGGCAKDMYEYLELTSDFMQLVTRQDIFDESDRHRQRRVVWDRRLV